MIDTLAQMVVAGFVTEGIMSLWRKTREAQVPRFGRGNF